MEVISTAFGYITLVAAVVLIMALALAGLWLWIFIKRKKNAGKPVSEDVQPRIDYNSFDRRDAVDYVKFDDIVDFNYGGAIVTNNGTRFVAGLLISGYDYDMASAEEHYRSMSGMIRVTNAITEPIMVHQDARQVDLTDNIRHCNETIKNLSQQLETLRATYGQLELELRSILDFGGGEDAMENCRIALENNLAEQSAVYNMMREQEAIIEELNNTSGVNVAPKRITCYLCDWTYNPADFASRALDQKGIYKEARQRLWSKLYGLSMALQQCGVKTKIMSCDELLETQYHHFHPYSSAHFKMEDIFGSSYRHLYTTLDTSNMEDEAYDEYMAATAGAREDKIKGIDDETVDRKAQEEKAREAELLERYGYVEDSTSMQNMQEEPNG